MKTTTLTPAAEDLARALALLGYREGPPPSLSPAVLTLDRRIYSHMACEACKGRGMAFAAFHRGAEYRAVVTCRQCGHQQEV
jgi:hypothetical protein